MAVFNLDRLTVKWIKVEMDDQELNVVDNSTKEV